MKNLKVMQINRRTGLNDSENNDIELEQLGDVAALDALEGEVIEGEATSASETAEAQRELDQNDGIAFPYDPVLAQSVTMYIGIGSGIAARKYGPHWQFKKEEAESLSVATCQLIQHYLPDLEPTNPLMNFAMVAGVVVGPRVMLTAMNSKAQKKVEQQSEDEGKQDES